MTSDGHKGITIDYNYLNLPIQVLKSNEVGINWAYNAVGNNLSKTVVKDSLLINDNVIPDRANNPRFSELQTMTKCKPSKPSKS